jgi:hypothetical protein
MRQGRGREQDRDLGTEIEEEMRASGRGHVMPREGLVGAHEQRREGLATGGDDGMVESPGRGSEVAPTATAEARERQRHQVQRQMGVVPAGADGNLRQRRGGQVSRAQLDRSGQEADQQLVEEQLFEDQEALESSIEDPRAWTRRAGAWLNQHRRTVALVAGAAVVAAVSLTAAARARDGG